jgi:hypothetical protein
MTNIDLYEPDGSKPTSICEDSRAEMVRLYRIDSIIALRFFSDEYYESSRDPTVDSDSHRDKQYVSHIRECSKCVDWIHAVVGPQTMERQCRLVQYCCASMFAAVEEAKINRIEFKIFRGEDPCWSINGQWSFMQFCPWCGTQLPDHPFVEERLT